VQGTNPIAVVAVPKKQRTQIYENCAIGSETLGKAVLGTARTREPLRRLPVSKWGSRLD